MLRVPDRQALEVLTGSPTFSTVKPFLAAIREARRSGLVVTYGKPTFRVGRPTWQAPLLWFASAIVHDAGHAKRYLQNRRRFLSFMYTPPGAWTGTAAERVCLWLQLAALRELKAARPVEQYVESLLKNPTYHRKLVRWW